VPLVVETGAGVAEANSYVSVADATAFFTARGLTFADYEQRLLQAMDSIEVIDFVGTKTHSVNDLRFPRTGITNREGVAYEVDEVPKSIVTAQLWLAHYISGGTNPGAVAASTVKREKVDTLEVEYAVSDTYSKILTVFDLPNVYNALKHLLDSTAALTGDNVWCGRTVRA